MLNEIIAEELQKAENSGSKKDLITFFNSVYMLLRNSGAPVELLIHPQHYINTLKSER